MTVMVNANNILAWLIGDFRNTDAMKERVKQGYEGSFSDHVSGYDELGTELQTKAASSQLEGVDLNGKEVLDVGCGTGIISFLAVEKGAAKVVCGDISSYMLEVARSKAGEKGYVHRMDFRQLDADFLPFENETFDLVVSGLVLGLIPYPEKALAEMVRVLRPGGFVSLTFHGPECYWEAVDASFRSISKQYVLGYRLEFWPRNESEVHGLLADAGLKEIKTRRLKWFNNFRDGAEAYDIFSAISSNWWYAKVPPEKRDKENRKTRAYFEKKGVTAITDDIVIAYARKDLLIPAFRKQQSTRFRSVPQGFHSKGLSGVFKSPLL
jgi:ubiquinone/menaquinone biosynthesis C-methylase UbiE